MDARRWARGAWEVLRCLGPMVLIEISIRFEGLPTTCRRFGVSCDLDSASEPAAQLAVLPRRRRRAALAALLVVSRWPAGDTCLRRCLLVGHRLRDLGPVLRIGVRRDGNGEFSAHSWLEIGNGTLDPTATQFAPVGSGRA